LKEICYWSVGDGDYALMLQSLVYSFRQVGMEDDFYAISDRQIDGATLTFNRPQFDKIFYLFKFKFLLEILSKLDYRYFVFIDADCYFVRKLTGVLDLMQGSPIHVFLESDCTSQLAVDGRGQWRECPLPVYVKMMRDKGVTSSKIYNLNAGFFIVERSAIFKVHMLAYDFWFYTFRQGWQTTEEPALAYAMHMMCGDPDLHTLRRNPDVFATDWLGHFQKVLPVDETWDFTDYMTGEKYPVRPAIVHSFVNKDSLIALGNTLRNPTH